MAKADRDEAERLNSKNSVEEYIYEIRFSFGTLLKSWSALLQIEAVENLNPLSGARFAMSWRISCLRGTEKGFRVS